MEVVKHRLFPTKFFLLCSAFWGLIGLVLGQGEGVEAVSRALDISEVDIEVGFKFDVVKVGEFFGRGGIFFDEVEEALVSYGRG